MAYLPGVPDMGPKPIEPSVSTPTRIGVGHQTGIAKVAATAGKPGNSEHIGSVVGKRSWGISKVGGGDPLAHFMGNYAKPSHPTALGSLPGTPSIDPTAHPGVKMIRGGGGRFDSHIREGGLGPGRMSTPGGSGDYNQPGGDIE